MKALFLKPLPILLLVPAFLIAHITTKTFAQNAADSIETKSALKDHCPKVKPQTVKVISISHDADLILEDGQQLTLANIFFPRTSPNAGLPKKTLQFLEDHLAHKTITYLASAKTDRYQRTPAHIITNSGESVQNWFQLLIIKSGIGLFMPQPLKASHNFYCDSDDLKQILQYHDQQNMAQKNRYQLTPVYHSNSKVLWQRKGNFAIVEGAVLKTHISKNTIFLNFGSDWKSDFTAVISADNKPSLQKHFKSISNLEGKRLRLRGFLDLYNRPSMRIDHPLQIEMLHE